ncbi:MAG: endopeptidase La [Opitutaceae bacterium]|nr:endopeptidase La [Cytophagales bacterium]
MLDDGLVEMVPIMPTDEELKQVDLPDELPILPIRNTVLFPGVVIPITVGRQKSIKLVKKAYKGSKIIGVVAQEKPTQDDATLEDIYKTGTVALILKMLVLPDGNTTIIIQGKQRFKIDEVTSVEPYIMAKVSLLPENFPVKLNREQKALIQTLRDSANKILRLNPEIPREAQIAINNIESPAFLAHFLSSNANIEVTEKQKLLETLDGIEQINILLEYLNRDIQLLELKNKIQNKVNSDIDQQQRDYFLRQQIKALQEELGIESHDQEVEKLRAKGDKKKWPEAISKHFAKELDKLSRINPSAAEYPMALNYVEFLVDLPWNEFTKDNFDLQRAKKVLDKEHFGLDKVKERIIEYLAVLKLKNEFNKQHEGLKAPILCLYGPPGVGKTSLGRSIAKALNRKYVRMSLGGLRDEAEIRGHRRTYIGAMPGRIISSLKKAQSSNPVFILDEIDKVGSDFRGDPSSALLEVLDPEQNNAFADNYLDLDYDLSKILFIATSNALDTIHPALRDRMEIIELNGYTLEEKLEIAKSHLLPKQKLEHGIKNKDLAISDEGMLKIIDGYTRESGVRNLERQIGTVIRKIAKKMAAGEVYPKSLRAKEVIQLLGAETFDKEIYEDNRYAGVVTGLAWTSVGGEILFIESSLSKGKGKLTISGQLGDVMKESAMAALSYLKSIAVEIGIDYRVFDNYDLHIHVPAGAVPKDGPSAGITMLTSLASVFTQRKVRPNLAMTGEITLSGRVLPVGGIKEKILAAKRAGIKDIILCNRNKKDIDEMSQKDLTGLNINFVNHASEVLKLALLDEKVSRAIEFEFDEKAAVHPAI